MSIRFTLVSLTNGDRNVFSEDKTVTIQNLLSIVCALFNTEPTRTQLLYLDDEQDIIRVTTTQDLRIVIEQTPESRGVTFFLTTTPPSLQEYLSYKSLILRYFSNAPNIHLFDSIPAKISESGSQPREQTKRNTPAVKGPTSPRQSNEATSSSSSVSDSESSSSAYCEEYSYPPYYYYSSQTPYYLVDSTSSSDTPTGYYDYCS